MISRASVTRAIGVLALLGAALGAAGQSPSGTAGSGDAARFPSLFRSVKPEATVILKKHPTGADLVEVSVVREDYPPEALRAACEKLGTLAGTPVRGLLVTNATGFLKATFATNGLIGANGEGANDQGGRLKIAPVVKAFGFGSAPLRALAILYDGEPADTTTIRTYRDEPGTFRVEGQRLPNGVEYRTFVDPRLKESEVAFVAPGARAKPVPAKGRDWTLPAVLVLGAIAAGVLVYSLASRRSAGTVRARGGRGPGSGTGGGAGSGSGRSTLKNG